MHRSMNNYDIKQYDPSNFYKINREIFDKEEEKFNNKKIYDAISLVSVMLVDLGIIYSE